jgi:hypothetical protein
MKRFPDEVFLRSEKMAVISALKIILRNSEKHCLSKWDDESWTDYKKTIDTVSAVLRENVAFRVERDDQNIVRRRPSIELSLAFTEHLGREESLRLD